jgi:hypothetical protein
VPGVHKDKGLPKPLAGIGDARLPVATESSVATGVRPAEMSRHVDLVELNDVRTVQRRLSSKALGYQIGGKPTGGLNPRPHDYESGLQAMSSPTTRITPAN